MKKTWLKRSTVLTLASILVGCSETTLISPETNVKSVVSAKEEIELAIKDGKVVKSVLPIIANSYNGWTIRFTDDTSIRFIGNDQEGSPSSYITIGNDSCWYISDDNGEYYTPLTSTDNNKIHAINDVKSSHDILQKVMSSKTSMAHSLVEAIAEDNFSHDISIVLANNEIYTLPKVDNVLNSFSITVDDNKGVINDNLNYCIGMNKLVVINPYVFDKSHIIARFSTNPENKVVVKGVEQTSGVTPNDFTNGVDYHIISPDGLNNVYKVSINNTGLPVVMINTPENKEITSKTTWMEKTQIKIVNPDGSIDYADDELQIRGRGNSTWGYPKKPYALKLNKKSSVLGMPKHKRWVLLANWMDRTLMRNDFAFEIARNTGLEWTPRGRFVEVILNGKHIGNYYLCEQIKEDKNRVDITEMSETDIEGEAVTGGYLMELDVYYDEVNKFKSKIRNLPYMFKYPDEDGLKPEQFSYFQNYVNNLEELLYSDNWLENRHYVDYMDLESFADWWFVYELSMNGEAGWPKSCYMHKDRGGKLIAGPVWDFDWGTFTPEGANAYYIKEAIYYNQLFKDPKFVEIVKNRWNIHKAKFDKISSTMRQQAKKIRHSERFNHALWPVTSTVNGDEDMTFDAAVERMINSYQTKLEWMDQQIKELNAN